jgi:hypothetical protein
MRNLSTTASTTLSVVGVIAIVAGLLLAYTSETLFNADTFGDRMAASLKNDAVADLAASRVTDAVISLERNLTPYRPLVLGAVRAVVTSDAFGGIVRRAARTANEAALSGERGAVILTVSDLGVILNSALASQPELAGEIPANLSAALGTLEDIPSSDFTLVLLRLARGLSRWARLLVLSGLGLMFLGLLTSTSRLRTLLQQGLGLIFVSLALFVLVRFGGEMGAFSVEDPLVARALAGIWSTFTADFLSWVFVLSGIGLVMVAGATSLLTSFRPLQLARLAWGLLSRPPQSRGLRLLRGLALIGVGFVIVLWPLKALITVTFLSGVCVGFVGLGEVFDVLLSRMRPGAGDPGVAGRRPSTLKEAALIGTVAIIIIAGGLIFLNTSADTVATPATVNACNGYAELCDRRLNEVVFAGTHNSMGAADIPDWMFANQEHGIIRQLEDGVRALMIDAHPAVPVGDKVKTLLEDESGARASYEEVLGKEGVGAAMRIRDRLVGGEEGKPGIYLCHGFCELGALEITAVLRSIKDFLIANPNEVLIVIIQDEGVPPRDIAGSFEESGLIDFVYRGSVKPPWPTLREMVAKDQRVLVMAENESEGVPWYHSAFEVMQETPYRFHDPTEFSCAPNRGGTGGSLLLMNHWIETAPHPLPRNAEIVNTRSFLLTRARRCQKERGQLPNIIAVDFYATGDLIDVVADLNGIPSK